MAVRPANNSFDAMTLAAAARRSSPAHWRIFMEALGTALSQVAGDEQALRVLAAVGATIAREQPVPVCNSLADQWRQKRSGVVTCI